MHRHTGALADGVQPFDHGIVVAVMRRNHLTVNIGGDTTHLVVNCRHDRNRVADRIDIGELDRDLADRGQLFDDLVCAEVIELEQNVIAVRAAAAPFLDFLIHRARDEVARCEILERGRIALHEALAVLVKENSAFAAYTFGDQHAGAGHTGGMKLPELHVFEGQPSAGSHAHTITSVDEGIGRRCPDTTGSASGQHGDLRLENHHVAGFHLEGHDSDHGAFGITDQIERHPLDKELGAGADIALVEGVQQGVTSTIGGSAGTLNRFFAEVGGMPAERSLIDRAIGIAIEGHAEVLKLVDHLGRHLAHVLDRVLVAEIVGPLDGVEHMPVPVVLAHVAERRTDTALRGHGMRAGREDL